MIRKFQHDHDEELSEAWYGNSSPDSEAVVEKGAALASRFQHRDNVYWIETGNLVREYLRLQAGAAYSETIRQGFIAWLQRFPAERRAYIHGDDMHRAALVDWYLKVVR